jgi:subtilisin family serine protease
MTPRHTRTPLAVGLVAGLAVALALPAGAAVAAPAGDVRLASGAKAVPGSYVVVLKESAVDRAGSARAAVAVPSTATGLAGRYGATVKRTYTAALTGFEAAMDAATAARLAADPAVAYVEQNSVVSIADTQTGATWGLDRIDQRARPLNSTYNYATSAGVNVTAYIIDTGIRLTHGQFTGRVRSGRDTVNNDNDASDCNGHGTHVAGTVGGSTHGVAKRVSLVAVRVLSCSGSGSLAGVIAGIDWVTSDHAAGAPAVANMSLGGGASSSLDSAVTRSIADGVSYAIAAGNSNANACNASPARTPNAITVGSTTSTDARSSFSNFGACLDIFAPGSSITSAWSTGDSATRTISGTSMATPHVAGAAALYLSGNRSATPAAVTSALTTNATANVVTNAGSGSPNRLLYTAFVG